MSIESIKYNIDICDDCAHKGYCDMALFGGHNPRIVTCTQFSKSKPTNGDSIRAMTDEALAEFAYYNQFRTMQEMLDWLKQEATE